MNKFVRKIGLGLMFFLQGLFLRASLPNPALDAIDQKWHPNFVQDLVNQCNTNKVTYKHNILSIYPRTTNIIASIKYFFFGSEPLFCFDSDGLSYQGKKIEWNAVAKIVLEKKADISGLQMLTLVDKNQEVLLVIPFTCLKALAPCSLNQFFGFLEYYAIQQSKQEMCFEVLTQINGSTISVKKIGKKEFFEINNQVPVALKEVQKDFLANQAALRPLEYISRPIKIDDELYIDGKQLNKDIFLEKNGGWILAPYAKLILKNVRVYVSSLKPVQFPLESSSNSVIKCDNVELIFATSFCTFGPGYFDIKSNLFIKGFWDKDRKLSWPHFWWNQSNTTLQPRLDASLSLVDGDLRPRNEMCYSWFSLWFYEI